MKTIYNQIDYIIMNKNKVQTLTDARAYSGSETASDHRIVVARMQVLWSKIYNNKNVNNEEKRFNTNKLINDKVIRENYQNDLESKTTKREK